MPKRSLVALGSVVIVCGALAVGCGSKEADEEAASTTTTATTRDQPSQVEEQLNGKPPYEVALTEYKTAVQGLADYIGALNHGTAWAYNGKPWLACSGGYPDSEARVVHLSVGFSQPISDAAWAGALQSTKNVAAGFGATEFGVRTDEPGDHDVYFAGPDGILLELSSQAPASLTATSDCRRNTPATG